MRPDREGMDRQRPRQMSRNCRALPLQSQPASLDRKNPRHLLLHPHRNAAVLVGTRNPTNSEFNSSFTIQNPTFKIHHRAPPSPAFPSTAPKALSAVPSSSPACQPGKSARITTTKPALLSSEPPALSNYSPSFNKSSRP